MRLVIDLGNTNARTALVRDGCVVDFFQGPLVSERVRLMAASTGVKSCICSSVRNMTPSEINFLNGLPVKVRVLDGSLRLPIKIMYSTPETLGSDRIAAAVGAWQRYPNRNILVIDAGTAITYDMVTADGKYMGGNISPGKDIRLRALHEYTGRLPLVKSGGDTPVIGYSTDTALRSGVLLGIEYEIEGYISAMSQQYDSLLVFLTGGDAELFGKPIKNRIFADVYLVLEGLYYISRYNEES